MSQTVIQLKFDENIQKESVSKYQLQSLQSKFQNNKIFQGCKIESASKDETIHYDQGNPFGSKILNGFAEAVHLAYENHHGLTLSPDHLFITILQGLSIHITQNPEKYRAVVGLGHTQANSKETITISRDHFQLGNPNNDWEGVFPDFLDEIGKRVDAELKPLLINKFSTSSERDVAVSALTIMDVYKSYFEFALSTMCGIPEIILQGNAEDWILLKQRVDGILGRFDDLQFWTDALYPILDEFISATSGKPINEEFWKSIYKISGGSGGPYIQGWIRGLYPYLSDQEDDGPSFRKNYWIDWKEELDCFSGITFNQFPTSFTSTPFVWQYFHDQFKMKFIGGLLGAKVEPTNNHISPAVGWVVMHEESS